MGIKSFLSRVYDLYYSCGLEFFDIVVDLFHTGHFKVPARACESKIMSFPRRKNRDRAVRTVILTWAKDRLFFSLSESIEGKPRVHIYASDRLSRQKSSAVVRHASKYSASQTARLNVLRPNRFLYILICSRRRFSITRTSRCSVYNARVYTSKSKQNANKNNVVRIAVGLFFRARNKNMS